MKVFIDKKLVLESQRGMTVHQIMKKLGLLETEYLPYDPSLCLPTTPDFRVPDDGMIVLIPVLKT